MWPLNVDPVTSMWMSDVFDLAKKIRWSDVPVPARFGDTRFVTLLPVRFGVALPGKTRITPLPVIFPDPPFTNWSVITYTPGFRVSTPPELPSLWYVPGTAVFVCPLPAITSPKLGPDVVGTAAVSNGSGTAGTPVVGAGEIVESAVILAPPTTRMVFPAVMCDPPSTSSASLVEESTQARPYGIDRVDCSRTFSEWSVDGSSTHRLQGESVFVSRFDRPEWLPAASNASTWYV